MINKFKNWLKKFNLFALIITIEALPSLYLYDSTFFAFPNTTRGKIIAVSVIIVGIVALWKLIIKKFENNNLKKPQNLGIGIVLITTSVLITAIFSAPSVKYFFLACLIFGIYYLTIGIEELVTMLYFLAKNKETKETMEIVILIIGVIPTILSILDFIKNILN